MQSIQEVFNRIQEAKKEQKDIKSEYRDMLSQSAEYQEIAEKLEELREKKKQIEAGIQGQLGKRYERFDELKGEIESSKEMLTDIAISTLMDGKTVEVEDQYHNHYDPVYAVKFKKSNAGETVGKDENKEIA